MSYPYKRIRTSRTTTKDEHRIIMEQELGRELTFNDIVHHGDEDKKNNDPDNLKIMTRSDHARLHHPHRDILTDEGRQRLRKVHKGKPKYCCTRHTREEVAEIFRLRAQGLTQRAIQSITSIEHSTVCNILNGKILAYRPENLDKLPD